MTCKFTKIDKSYVKMKIYSIYTFFSAAVATRQFLISLQKYQEKSKDVLSLLLPRLCLNRYYLAEGVRIYSQETWVLTVGQNGKSLVEDNIDNFVKYYIECTQVINLGPDKSDLMPKFGTSAQNTKN